MSVSCKQFIELKKQEYNTKIALCFLTYDNLSKADLWYSMLKKTNKFNVYIHNKREFIDYKYNFHKYVISNKVSTEYGHISLVSAALELFREAYSNSSNKLFILLSDKCIPLYSLDTIYSKLLNYNNNIFTSISNDELLNRFLNLNNSFFDVNEFKKQSQWMVLTRDSVNWYLHNDYRYIWNNYLYNIPDEHYFISLANKFHIKYINKIITYVNWENEDNINKRSFHILNPKNGFDIAMPTGPVLYKNLTNDMIYTILKLDALFMRKIDKNCKLPSYFDNF